jgi:hypothetical protein
LDPSQEYFPRKDNFETEHGLEKRNFEAASKELELWTCNICGKKNDYSVQNCICCRKPRAMNYKSGWICVACKYRNISEESFECVKCKNIDMKIYEALAPKVVKPTIKIADPEQKTAEKKVNPLKEEVIVEIWECKCGQSNMPDYNICIKCENLKPGLKGWVCNTCKVLNEEYSSKCSACSNNKDSGLLIPQEFWLCEKCNTAIVKGINFCESCRFVKQERENKKVRNIFDEDRYAICSNCDKQTLKYSGKCLWCHSTLNDQLREEKKNEEKGEYLNRSDEKFWTCGNCNELNASLRTYCSKCFEDKKNMKLERNREVYMKKKLKKITLTRTGNAGSAKLKIFIMLPDVPIANP